MSYSGGTGPIPTPLVAPVAGTKILLRRTSTADKKPEAGTAEYGELFINYHSTSPMLCFKDNAANIVEIRPLTEVELALGELTDVDTTGATTGMVLSYNGSTWVPVSAASIAIDVDLGYTPAADKGTVTNTAGDDATIPLATGTNAGLSLNNYTTTEKDKLAAVIPGANVNVNADWNASSGDAEILNKPDIPDELGDLSDVDTSGATSGQLLRYDGAEWKPGSPAAVNVDLGYTSAADKGTVTNDSGDDATLPLVDGSNAGLMAPGDYTKLSGIQAGAEVNVDPTISYNVLNDGKDGTLIISPGGDTAIIDNATVSKAGLMTKGDKSKLDGYPATPGDISGTQDLQSVTDNGNTTTNGAEFGSGSITLNADGKAEAIRFVPTNGDPASDTHGLASYSNKDVYLANEGRVGLVIKPNTTQVNHNVAGEAFTITGQPPESASTPRGIRLGSDYSKTKAGVTAVGCQFYPLNTVSENDHDFVGFNVNPHDITLLLKANSSNPNTFYGYYSAIPTTDANYRTFGFYSTPNSAPNFFGNNTYIGGSVARNTRQLWESLLTEEQKEQLEAGTLAIPANVSTPGDGAFIRQWWYDQQSAEHQALIDSGELEYPEKLQPANFVDSFALGDNTNIQLKADGSIVTRHNGPNLSLYRNTADSQGLVFTTDSNGNTVTNVFTTAAPKYLTFENFVGDTDTITHLASFAPTNGDFEVGPDRSNPNAIVYSNGGARFKDNVEIGPVAGSPAISLIASGRAVAHKAISNNAWVDITAGAWNVQDSNCFAVKTGTSTLAAPTMETASESCSGLLYFEVAVSAFSGNFVFPGGTTPSYAANSVVPYTVKKNASGALRCYMGKPTEVA